MRYYVLHNKTPDISGPFTIEELIDAIRAGRIAPDSLASSDLGDSITKLRTWRRCDWFPLAAIPELQHIVPPLPEPPVKQWTVSPRSLCFTWLSLVIVVVFFLIREDAYPHWHYYLILVNSAWFTVYATLRYFKQRSYRILAG